MTTNTTAAVTAEGKEFKLKGNTFQFLCGAIHYFRVTPDSWEDRIKKAKGMGLNCIDIYIPWNLHEPSPGKFSSKYTEQLRTFLNIIQENDMYAVLRPGPYICSEWDFGGLPSWLLEDEDMKVRTMYHGFIDAVTRYFDHLLPLLSSYQHANGGPIIAFQIENEYGSFGSDSKYMKFIQKVYEKHDLIELYFVCDNMEGIGNYKMDEKVLQTINFMTKPEKAVDKLLSMQPNKPVFVTEFWDGWFTHWGEKYHTVDTQILAETLKYLLEHGYSVNFYMLHGGTNFGFYNGANADDDGYNYQCDITSYDYDAPISEGGEIFEMKYVTFKQIIEKYALSRPKDSIKPVLDEESTAEYGNIEMKYQATIDDVFSSKHLEANVQADVCNMEKLKMADGSTQQYGYVVYETNVKGGNELNIQNARDYVYIIINQQVVKIVTDIQETITMKLEGYLKTGTENKLQIVVENAGRVNYGLDLTTQRKGILGTVKIDGDVLKGWKMYSLQFDEDWVKSLTDDENIWKTVEQKKSTHQPTIYKGVLDIQGRRRDTYFKMPGWYKGVVFINGHNLGRFWALGPQKTLYVPKYWLRSHDNVIVLFDLKGDPDMTKCDGKKLPCVVSVDTRDLGESKSIEFNL